MSSRPSLFYRALLAFLRFVGKRRAARREKVRASGFVPSDAQALAALRAATGRPSFPVALSSLQIRDWSDVVVPGGDGACRARLYRPRGRVDGVVLFLHGGGFVHCDLVSHHGICCRLARQSHAMIVSLDYRLAPEHPFPAAVEDVWAALRWAAGMARLYDLPVAVAGDSAGGNLAAVAAQIARDEGGPEIAGQLLYYPALTGALEPDSRLRYGDGYMLTTAVMEWYVRAYLAAESLLTHRRFAPALAERFDGLPPAMVITAEFDPLRGEGEIYRDRLAAAGVPVIYRMVPGAIHGFLNFYAMTADGRKALREGARFLSRCFAEVRVKRG